MEGFTLAGNDNYIKIEFKEIWGFPETTACFGGYDVEVMLEIKSGDFHVTSSHWATTGIIYELYEGIKYCNEQLKGSVDYNGCEHDLNFSLTYDQLGHVIIKGSFKKATFSDFANANKLEFEFYSDQSYMSVCLTELVKIVNKYGGMKGVKI